MNNDNDPYDDVCFRVQVFADNVKEGNLESLSFLYDAILQAHEEGQAINEEAVVVLLKSIKRPKNVSSKQAQYTSVLNNIDARMVFKKLSYYSALKDYFNYLQKSKELTRFERSLREYDFEELRQKLKLPRKLRKSLTEKK